MKKFTVIGLGLLILFNIVLAVVTYLRFDGAFATHWNVYGEADGYMSKFWGIALIPIMEIVMAGMLWWLPRIDGRKKELMKSIEIYEQVVLFIMSFFTIVFLMMVIWNMGVHFDMGKAMTPFLGILFIVIGQQLPRMKQNWWMGIRTKWTMESEAVWEKTHKMGRYVFGLMGLLVIGFGLLPAPYNFVMTMIVIMSGVFGLIGYSWWEYRKENN